MIMEIQADPPPKLPSLLLGTINRIRPNIQPSITKHEVFLFHVCSSPVAMDAWVAASNASSNNGSPSVLQLSAFWVSMLVMM
jgi:hypothetical protein